MDATAFQEGHEQVEGKRALDAALGLVRSLSQLNHALERVSSQMAKSWSVTMQQTLILHFVGKHPGISAGQLANLLYLDPGTISASLRRLELKGLLERSRDQNDRRKVRLALTPSGHALERPATAAIGAVMEQLFVHSNPELLSSADAVLRGLNQLVYAQIARSAAPRRARSKCEGLAALG